MKNEKFIFEKTININPIKVKHGTIDSLSFIINNKIAYLPDANEIYKKDLDKFRNLEYIIIDCLRYTKHPSHFNLPDVLDLNLFLKPNKMILTNLHSDLDYKKLLDILPKNIKPAYDGLSIKIDNEKNKIIITGGAGFVGSNLIDFLKKTKYKIISIDNYSSGSKRNHVYNSRVKYINGDTKDIEKLISKPKEINSIFHFGEFARIYQSFLFMNECIRSNTIGTNSVLNFCLKNKIKLIYSATSASLGNRGLDKNLSPYAFTKSKNLELLENLKKWYGFRFEVIYFYNVYGPKQITTGKMSTVIGIFEDAYKRKKPLPVVKPGTQTRRFTHIDDTIEICYLAWKKNKCRHYSISNKKSYSILEVAKMFNRKIRFLQKRPGERYVSALTKNNLSNKVYRHFGKIKLTQYIKEFINKKIKEIFQFLLLSYLTLDL